MFVKSAISRKPGSTINTTNRIVAKNGDDPYSEMKIGAIARTVLRFLLESNKLSKETIKNLQLIVTLHPPVPLSAEYLSVCIAF